MNLVACEIFNDKIYGFDSNNDPTVLGHYMVLQNFSESDTNTESDTESETSYSINSESEYSIFDKTKPYLKIFKSQNNNIIRRHLTLHPLIRNYKYIISRPNYIQLHIAKVIYLSGSECVAILKTFWIKLIQRTWKKIYKQRCNIIALRKLPNSHFYKERTGKWPSNCINLPSLYGMLTS